jgi:hypothetical protein
LNEDPHPLQLRVPAFERFTTQARRAIGAAAETAARLEHREVQPFHLLLGCLQVPDSFAARVLAELCADRELARGVVAEDALALAYRHGTARSRRAICCWRFLTAAIRRRSRWSARTRSDWPGLSSAGCRGQSTAPALTPSRSGSCSTR